MGIEPTLSAWKAEVLPLNYARRSDDRAKKQPDQLLTYSVLPFFLSSDVEGVGFEPTKAEPSDLQSDPFGRSGTPPYLFIYFIKSGNGFCFRMKSLSSLKSLFPI